MTNFGPAFGPAIHAFKDQVETPGRAQDKEDGGGLETLRVDGYM